MKLEHFTLSSLIILCSILLFLSMSPEAYSFNHWLPVQTLKSLGIPVKLIILLKANIDTIVHFFGAFCTTTLLLFSSQKYFKKSFLNYLALTLILTVLFIMVEFLQINIGRSFSVKDITAGTTGSLLSILCFDIIAKTQKNSKQVL